MFSKRHLYLSKSRLQKFSWFVRLKMSTSFCLLLSLILAISVISAPLRKYKSKTCGELPSQVLGEILGPAFNPRYMSISEPQELDLDQTAPGTLKRTPIMESEFYVDDYYSKEISDTPAWKTNHLAVKRDSGKRVSKRAVKQVRQWECSSKIRWQDLGPDYYPRYLRSVECTSNNCWYDMMRCRPRSFTVKLLRRKDRCVKDEGLSSVVNTGSVGLPTELRELWVWEERAVNFCCDCAI